MGYPQELPNNSSNSGRCQYKPPLSLFGIYGYTNIKSKFQLTE